MDIDISTCSSISVPCSTVNRHSLIKWNCSPTTAVSILRFAHRDKDNIIRTVRQHYEDACSGEITLRLHINNVPIEDIDRKWESRVFLLFIKYFDLERLMWNLSTLGGAYSAMADYDLKFAARAEQISMHQLRIATELGDPAIIARCHLYIAMSTAQKGNIEHARKIVRIVYAWSRKNSNDMLERCCKGVYMKIKAIQMLGTKALAL